MSTPFRRRKASCGRPPDVFSIVSSRNTPSPARPRPRRLTRLVLRKRNSSFAGQNPPGIPPGDEYRTFDRRLDRSRTETAGRNGTLELTPDRWASSGWKYRVTSIRDCSYFASPNKANYIGDTSYQFLRDPSTWKKASLCFSSHRS